MVIVVVAATTTTKLNNNSNNNIIINNSRQKKKKKNRQLIIMMIIIKQFCLHKHNNVIIINNNDDKKKRYYYYGRTTTTTTTLQQILITVLKITTLFSLLGGFLLTPKNRHHGKNNINIDRDLLALRGPLSSSSSSSSSSLSSSTSREHDELLSSSSSSSLECLRWKTTGFCPTHNNNGHPFHKLWRYGLYQFGGLNHFSCNDKIPLDVTGYCEVLGDDGKPERVFQKSSCSTKGLRVEQSKPYFQCSMVKEFMEYKTRALQYEPTRPILTTSTSNHNHNRNKRGIVMQVYPSVLPSVYAIIQLLRNHHNCQLPIELWSDDGTIFHHPILQKLMFDSLDGGMIIRRTIDDPKFKGYMTKPYSIAYSNFQHVLFLDSDNFPIRDPTYLFHTNEFMREGTIFWKDYWNPRHDDFFITQPSTTVLWELLGMTTGGDTNDGTTSDNDSSSGNSNDKDDDKPTSTTSNRQIQIQTEMEMESGQIVIDRTKCQRALKVLLFFAETYHEWFQPMGLVHGDKDLFRLAWHLTQTPYHYIHHLPGTAGLINHRYPNSISTEDVGAFYRTCGVTMVQFDTFGEPLFLHRNAAKLSTRADLRRVWDRMELFVGGRPDIHQYEIGDYYDLRHKVACCYPKATIHMYFQMITTINTNGGSVGSSTKQVSLATFEDQILAYAKEAFDILEEEEEQHQKQRRQ